MSRASSAAINYTLTGYAQGLANNILMAQAVALALCPIVPVSGAVGQYKTFDDDNSFRVYNTHRGLGGRAPRIEFGANDGTFACEPQALEVTVDDHERDLAAAGGNPLAAELLDQGKIRALINSTTLSHTTKIVDFVLANTTAVANRGNWSNADIDPIDQLDEQLEQMSTDVGSTDGITLTMSPAAWRALRSHKAVKARCSGVQVSGITLEQLQGLLMYPVRPLVGAISKLTSKIGQSTKTKANIIGGNVIITYSAPNPTIYDPSPFKLFTTGMGMVNAVRTWRDDSARSDVHAIDWSEDIKKTSALAVRRLEIT